jgi:heme/copper-type cytochrome/quinol oxidase subunit 1
MLVAWLWLGSVSGIMCGLRPRVVTAVFAIGALPILFVPLLYALYDVGSVEHIVAFTKLMEYGAGTAPVIIGLALLVAAATKWRSGMVVRPETVALLFSVILFGAGGLIGYLIREINVTVPAHYHGSIVAVTLSFMGLTYYLLPKLGFAMPSLRLAKWQPAIYGGGQLLHVMGLAWSGGYGVQRKTAGGAQGLDSIQEIAGMAIMGLGGLIAVIGGLLFLVIAIKSIMAGRQDKQPGGAVMVN